MLSHFALVDTGNLSMSSEETNGIMGKTSRIITEDAGKNSIRKIKIQLGAQLSLDILHAALSFKIRESYFFLVPLNCVLSVFQERSTRCN